MEDWGRRNQKVRRNIVGLEKEDGGTWEDWGKKKGRKPQMTGEVINCEEHIGGLRKGERTEKKTGKR